MFMAITFGTSQCLIGLYFRNIFLIGGLISVGSLGFIMFQSRIPKWLLSNSEAVNKCEDKSEQIMPVLK